MIGAIGALLHPHNKTIVGEFASIDEVELGRGFESAVDNKGAKNEA